MLETSDSLRYFLKWNLFQIDGWGKKKISSHQDIKLTYSPNNTQPIGDALDHTSEISNNEV